MELLGRCQIDSIFETFIFYEWKCTHKQLTKFLSNSMYQDLTDSGWTSPLEMRRTYVSTVHIRLQRPTRSTATTDKSLHLRLPFQSLLHTNWNPERRYACSSLIISLFWRFSARSIAREFHVTSSVLTTHITSIVSQVFQLPLPIFPGSINYIRDHYGAI